MLEILLVFAALDGAVIAVVMNSNKDLGREGKGARERG